MAQKKIEEVTQEFWENEVDEDNKMLIEEFLQQQHLSPATLKQYQSALKIFAKWVHDNCIPKGRKKIYELKARQALAYQNWLISKGLSSSGVKFKRSVVSSLCGYVEVYYGEEYPNFRNIFTKAIPNVANVKKKEKIPLTMEEIEKLISELEKRQEWQKVAYVLFSFSSGARKEEVRQLLTEVTSYGKYKDKNGNEKNYYLTNKIRCKGKGREGKVRKLVFDERTMNAIKKWMEKRNEINPNDDCPYVFVSKNKEGWKQISGNTLNSWCDDFSEILNKKVHPHLFRSSIATHYSNEGKDIKSIQSLLGHNDAATTQIYIISSDDGVDDLFD